MTCRKSKTGNDSHAPARRRLGFSLSPAMPIIVLHRFFLLPSRCNCRPPVCFFIIPRFYGDSGVAIPLHLHSSPPSMGHIAVPDFPTHVSVPFVAGVNNLARGGVLCIS